MKLSQLNVSTELEAVEFPERPDMTDGQPVVVSRTGDDGPNGHPMVRVSGTFAAVTTWLSTEYGMQDEDIKAMIPDFEVKLP